VAKVEGATFEWDVDPGLGAKVDGDTLTVDSMPAVGEYAFSVVAKDKNGKELAAEKNTIHVKELPELQVTFAIESEGMRPVEECKAGDFISILLEGCDWNWAYTEGCGVTWQVKNLDTGKVYDDSTDLCELNPEENGGIEAEDFANYDYPALTATFNEPGNYEITGTLVRANGKEFSATKTLQVK
jgi:hypothetical protein